MWECDTCKLVFPDYYMRPVSSLHHGVAHLPGKNEAMNWFPNKEHAHLCGGRSNIRPRAGQSAQIQELGLCVDHLLPKGHETRAPVDEPVRDFYDFVLP